MPDLGTTTATILFTDVVGSTELRSRLGETAADRVFIEHRRRLGTVIARHGGHIVKYTGDGMMASFAAASTAVHAAVAIQADVAEHGAGIVVRVGVAAGDVSGRATTASACRWSPRRGWRRRPRAVRSSSARACDSSPATGPAIVTSRAAR